MPSVVRRFKLCSGWLDFPFAIVSTESGGHCRSRRPPGEVTVGKIRPEQSLKVLGCGRFRKIENSSLKDFPARDSATVVLGPLRGHRRLQANRGAEALGRAEAVLWPMKEAAAVLPDRSLCLMDPGPGKSHRGTVVRQGGEPDCRFGSLVGASRRTWPDATPRRDSFRTAGMARRSWPRRSRPKLRRIWS
jgi:hypothetical protein